MKVPKINLDPSKRPKEVLTVFQGPVADRDPRKTVQQNGHTTTNTNIAQNGQNGGQNGTVSYTYFVTFFDYHSCKLFVFVCIYVKRLSVFAYVRRLMVFTTNLTLDQDVLSKLTLLSRQQPPSSLLKCHRRPRLLSPPQSRKSYPVRTLPYPVEFLITIKTITSL